jgi:hypothetical protein
MQNSTSNRIRFPRDVSGDADGHTECPYRFTIGPSEIFEPCTVNIAQAMSLQNLGSAKKHGLPKASGVIGRDATGRGIVTELAPTLPGGGAPAVDP